MELLGALLIAMLFLYPKETIKLCKAVYQDIKNLLK